MLFVVGIYGNEVVGFEFLFQIFNELCELYGKDFILIKVLIVVLCVFLIIRMVILFLYDYDDVFSENDQQ